MILAIDPGTTESGWVTFRDGKVVDSGVMPNLDLLRRIPLLGNWADTLAIEMVASYGMAVGREVFETCVWVGRFQQAWHIPESARLVYRRDVKLHHCNSVKAKDANITQALVDRFAPGRPNHGKGTKAEPGFFYGFKADIWQAYALAVYYADQLNGQVES